MTLARQGLVARSDVRTRIRHEIEDPDVLRNGNAVAAASRRWSDTEVDNAFNYALSQLSKDLGGVHAGENLVYTDSTYTASAVSVVLPAAIAGGDLIYKVEDLTDPARPRVLPYLSPLEVEHYASTTAWDSIRAAHYYSLVANGTDAHYVIRPNQAALAVRIWYIPAPVVTADDADTHALTAHWLELIVLSSALKLMRRDGEADQQQLNAYAELRDQFRKYSQRQAGPQRIRRKRKGWS